MQTIDTKQDTVADNDVLRQKLRHASTEALIQALITLTHKVHGRQDPVSDRHRLQREYVISEIKRRAADSAPTDGAA